ncbi:hypothetical protein EBU95_03905 [bacterium]|nr:hypothetical protein [bacterium]
MSNQEGYSIEKQFYVIDSKIAVTKNGNSVTHIVEKSSSRTYPDAKRIVGRLWINDVDYYEATWEYNPTLKIFEIENMVTEFSKMASNQKDEETSLGYKYGMPQNYDFLDDMYDLYSPEETKEAYRPNQQVAPFAKCECGSDSVNGPFHSSWCPKSKR